jgi:allophanate hydrolase
VVQRLLDAGAAPARSAAGGKTNLDQFACGLNGTRSPYGAVPNAFDRLRLGRLQLGLGLRGGGRRGRLRAGHRHRRLGPRAGRAEQHRRPQAVARADQRRGVVPAAQSADCVSIFARTVATAVACCRPPGHDPRDPYSRGLLLPLRRQPLPARFRFGVPDR